MGESFAPRIAVARTAEVRFSYARAGSGPPVVLVPGAGGWRLTFGAMVAELASRYTVYAVDPPGQGGTRVLGSDFAHDADAVALSIADFLDAVGLSQVAMVGHSWGGGFALRLAELQPERISRLVLLAPAGLDVPDVWEFRLLRLPIVGGLAARFTSAASLRHMLRKSFARPDRMPADEVLRSVAAAIRHEPSLRRDMLRVERSVRWRGTERDLGLVGCPVLILWGDRDRYYPATLLDRFAHRIPGVLTHILPGAGHSLHDDCPEQTYRHLNAFLDPPMEDL